MLEAAAQVLAREGYAGATTNRIAERAGLSVGTIYQYFSGKEQVFDALIRREIEGLVAILERVAFDPDESLTDALRRLLHQLVRARRNAPVLYRSLEQVPGALFRRRITEARTTIIEWVREFLASHRDEVRVRDLDVAAFVIVSAAEGVAINANTAFYVARGADELTTLFTRYLTGPDA